MSGNVLWLILQPPRFGLRAVRRCLNALLRCWLGLVLGRCGKRLQVQRPFVIVAPRQVHIGDDVALAAFLHIWGAGGVMIGNRVMIGSHTAITSVTHDYSLRTMRDSLIMKPVVIEDDVWIGAHCTILPGLRIGHGAVVGAGAVVTRDVPPEAIVAGVPAHVLKFRYPAPAAVLCAGAVPHWN
jgi:acetyltransferase-like isoleucine patch superfamily enzyme